MSRIGATISGIERVLLNRLSEANSAAQLNSLRLATGLKINAPSDNPTTFVTLGRFQNELSVVGHTLTNVTEASKLVSQAQLTIDQIRTQLDTIRTNAIADEDGQLTPSARAANQAAIDTAVAEIDRLSGTQFGSRRLLDGSANFQTEGVNPQQIDTLQVFSLGPASSQTISGSLSVAATQAQLTHTEATGLITADATFTLDGDRGSVSISVTNGESLATVRDRINAESHRTGVTAAVSGNDLQLTSIAFGTDADTKVNVTSGTFAVTGGDGNGNATGTDAQATINGDTLTGSGNRFDVNVNGFRFSLEFKSGFAPAAFDTITASGEALTFALSTDVSQRSTLAIPGLQPERLGGLSGTLDQLVTGGTAAGLNSNAPLAVRVVDEAIAGLDRVEGLVDGFANAAISASSALLTGFNDELTKAIDSINKVDSAEEGLLQQKNQSLANNALAGLSLLDTQRAGIVVLLQKAAGLI